MTDAEQMEVVLKEMSKGWKKFLEHFYAFKNKEISEKTFLLFASCLLMNKTYLATDTSDELVSDLADHLPPAFLIEIDNLLDDGAF